MIKSGELRHQLQSVRFCTTANESRELNNVKGPCMIMAGSGMCTGGRIVHHLRHNLYRPETAVLIVGFQSPGTVGRQLVDGAKSVYILSERVVVRASIHTLGGFSAHADQNGLLDWFASVAPSRPRLILIHGENRARKTFLDLIRLQHGLRPECPNLGDVIEI